MFSRPVRLSLLTLALGCAAPLQQAEAADAAMSAFLARQAKLQALGDTTTTSKGLSERIFAAGFEASESGGSAACDLDSDGDALPDCAETGTGVFIDDTNTGTDPQSADTDGDGLGDGEEVVGTLGGLDLPALGVNPLRKDLLVEYDWFEDEGECGAHSHRPTAEVMARVAAVYAAAPLQNPDGSTGINLIQDAGQGGALTGGNRIEGHPAVLPGAFDATWDAIKSGNFDAKRRGHFRYMLLAHRYNGGSNSSGYGEVVGDDSMVTLACSQITDYAARTIVHELGHNLGLNHGGYEACNGKPNYNSLMNYRYQFRGLDATCSAQGSGTHDGYSAGDRVSIDEANLDELKGVCGNPAIDWNQNGSVETGIALDLNPGNSAECGGQLSRINDFDDWANISLLGLRDAAGKLASIKQETGCAGAPTP